MSDSIAFGRNLDSNIQPSENEDGSFSHIDIHIGPGFFSELKLADGRTQTELNLDILKEFLLEYV